MWEIASIAGAVTAAVLLTIFREDRDLRPMVEEVLRRIRVGDLEWDKSPVRLPPELQKVFAERTAALSALGFRVAGELQVIDHAQSVAGVHLFTRVVIGPRNRIYGVVACNVVEGGRPEFSGPVQLQLVTESQDGGFIYAVERHAVPPDPFHPTQIVYRRQPHGVEPKDLVREHERGLQDVEAIEVFDLDDVEASQRREHAIRRDTRLEAARHGLSRRQVVALGGPPGPILSARVARAVRKRLRSPEPF